MKKFIETTIFLFILIIASLGFSSCGGNNDEYDESTPTNGTWYLVTYDGNPCDWGEYMKFSGSTLHWNKRSRGTKNTTYTFESTNNGFKCYNNDESYVFSIESSTSKNMVTYSSDGMIRVWER